MSMKRHRPLTREEEEEAKLPPPAAVQPPSLGVEYAHTTNAWGDETRGTVETVPRVIAVKPHAAKPLPRGIVAVGHHHHEEDQRQPFPLFRYDEEEGAFPGGLDAGLGATSPWRASYHAFGESMPSVSDLVAEVEAEVEGLMTQSPVTTLVPPAVGQEEEEEEEEEEEAAAAAAEAAAAAAAAAAVANERPETAAAPQGNPKKRRNHNNRKKRAQQQRDDDAAEASHHNDDPTKSKAPPEERKKKQADHDGREEEGKDEEDEDDDDERMIEQAIRNSLAQSFQTHKLGPVKEEEEAEPVLAAVLVVAQEEEEPLEQRVARMRKEGEEALATVIQVGNAQHDFLLEALRLLFITANPTFFDPLVRIAENHPRYDDDECGPLDTVCIVCLQRIPTDTPLVWTAPCCHERSLMCNECFVEFRRETVHGEAKLSKPCACTMGHAFDASQWSQANEWFWRQRAARLLGCT